MRFSLWPINQQALGDALTVARHAAATGWDGVWMSDHLTPSSGPMDTPVIECWTTMTAMMSTVPDIRVGSLVLSNTFRHPGLLAKMAATLDAVDPGRLVLGVGAGWQSNEHRAYGIELPPPRQRLQHLAESCAILRSMLTEGVCGQVGDRFRLDRAPAFPIPEQPIPLLLGAKGDRALRVVARHADEWNIWATPEVVAERSDRLASQCDVEGRDPAQIDRSAQAIVSFVDDGGEADPRWARAGLPLMSGSTAQMQAMLGAYRDAGLDEFIVPDFALGAGPRRLEAMDRFLAEVAEPFRGGGSVGVADGLTS